ncbi:MAG: FtsX protein [Campylobacterota bacterium]|nr:FtsX protein [Campylobacterota bacterium]
MNFFKFASLTLVRNLSKNIIVFIFFTLFIFIASSFIFTASSLQNSLDAELETQPDIIVQYKKASRNHPIDTSIIDEISDIPGVEKVYERIFGYYFFDTANKYINVLGIDFLDDEQEKQIKHLYKNFDLKSFLQEDNMLVSSSVKKLLEQYYYEKFFNFIVEDEEPKKVNIYGVFDKKINLFLNDSVIMEMAMAKDILGYEENEASEIAIIVPNKLEIDNIVQKLLVITPTSKIITKNNMYKYSHELYDYKGGIFLSLFITSFLGFLVIFYSQASSINGAGKKQIGILRAIGWSINDIIKWKMSEAVIVSFVSFLSGVLLSYVYIFLFKNNIFVSIFLGSENVYKDIILEPFFDINSFVILFFITIIPYLASTLHPAWKSSIADPTEAIK